jgi:hypothetical protein
MQPIGHYLCRLPWHPIHRKDMARPQQAHPDRPRFALSVFSCRFLLCRSAADVIVMPHQHLSALACTPPLFPASPAGICRTCCMVGSTSVRVRLAPRRRGTHRGLPTPHTPAPSLDSGSRGMSKKHRLLIPRSSPVVMRHNPTLCTTSRK